MATDRDKLKEKVEELEDEDMIRELLDFIEELTGKVREDDRKEDRREDQRDGRGKNRRDGKRNDKKEG